MPPYRNRALAKKSFAQYKKRNNKSVAYVKSPAATRGWKFRNTPGELKYNDIASATYACDTTGSITALNLLAIGTDANTREGRTVYNRTIAVTGVLGPQDASVVDHLARIILVWDSQPNGGAIATMTQILTAATSISNTNLDNRERFTILRDSKIAVAAVSGASGYALSPTTSCINWFVNLGERRTIYGGTTAVIGSVQTGALLLVTVGSAAAAAGSDFQATTRLRYHE